MKTLLTNLSAPAKEELDKYRNSNIAILTAYSSLRTPEENLEKYQELFSVAKDFGIYYINVYDKKDKEFTNTLNKYLVITYGSGKDDGKTLGFCRKQTKLLESPSFLHKYYKAQDFTETDNQDYTGVKYNCTNKIIRLATLNSLYHKGQVW